MQMTSDKTGTNGTVEIKLIRLNTCVRCERSRAHIRKKTAREKGSEISAGPFFPVKKETDRRALKLHRVFISSRTTGCFPKCSCRTILAMREPRFALFRIARDHGRFPSSRILSKSRKCSGYRQQASEFPSTKKDPMGEGYFAGYSGRTNRPNNFKVYWRTSDRGRSCLSISKAN